MPLFKTIQEDQNQKTMQLNLYAKSYSFTLNKNFCVSCQICVLACPKEAIKLEKQPKISGEKAKKAKVEVDIAKCNFCGICDVLCPYGAIRVTVNGENILSVVEKESFPRLIRNISVDSSKCPKDCIECEEACPLDLIQVTKLTGEGKAVECPQSLSEEDRKRLKVKIDIEKERCPCCRICEFKCPEGVLFVRKFFHGTIDINLEKCPDGCRDCLDVCPITGALYFSDEDKKIHVNETFCTYCGACKVVCPVEEALDIERTMISHTPVRSGAWNKACERLTSPIGITKELKTIGSMKARESLKKRFILKEE